MEIKEFVESLERMNFSLVFIFLRVSCVDSRCPRLAAGKVIPPGIKSFRAQSGPLSPPHAPSISAKTTAWANASFLRIALIVFLLPSRAGCPRLGSPRVLQTRCRQGPGAWPLAQRGSGARLCGKGGARETEARGVGLPTRCAATAQRVRDRERRASGFRLERRVALDVLARIAWAGAYNGAAQCPGTGRQA